MPDITVIYIDDNADHPHDIKKELNSTLKKLADSNDAYKNIKFSHKTILLGPAAQQDLTLHHMPEISENISVPEASDLIDKKIKDLAGSNSYFLLIDLALFPDTDNGRLYSEGQELLSMHLRWKYRTHSEIYSHLPSGDFSQGCERMYAKKYNGEEISVYYYGHIADHPSFRISACERLVKRIAESIQNKS